MAISSRGIRNFGVAVPLGLQANGRPSNTDELRDYIGRELGVTRNLNKQKSLIKAVTDPEDWLDDRERYINGLLDEATKFYQERLASYYNRGYSATESEYKAQNEANSYLQILMNDVEDYQPGATTIVAGAANRIANRDNNFMLANGRAESDKEIYKRMKAKKKAKKANKSSK